MAGGRKLFGLDPSLLALLQFVEVVSSPRLTERSPPLARLACGPFRLFLGGASPRQFPGLRLPRALLLPLASVCCTAGSPSRTESHPRGVREMESSTSHPRGMPVDVPLLPGRGCGPGFLSRSWRAGLGEALVDDTHLHALILVCAPAWPRRLLGCGHR